MAFLYGLMSDLEITDEEGNNFPSPFSFNLNKFSPTKVGTDYSLTSIDIKRFDLLIHKVYGSIKYEPFILLVNNIQNIHNLQVGDTITFYESSDIEDFILENSQVEG